MRIILIGVVIAGIVAILMYPAHGAEKETWLTGLRFSFKRVCDLNEATIPCERPMGRRIVLAWVNAVACKSPAAKAGVVIGDMIVRVNGRDVRRLTVDQFLNEVSPLQARRLFLRVARSENGKDIIQRFFFLAEHPFVGRDYSCSRGDVKA